MKDLLVYAATKDFNIFYACDRKWVDLKIEIIHKQDMNTAHVRNAGYSRGRSFFQLFLRHEFKDVNYYYKNLFQPLCFI